jgi:hypothetical protein
MRDETPAPIFIRFNFRNALRPLGFFQGRPSLVRCPTGFFPRSGCHDAHRGFPPLGRRDRLEAGSPSGLGPGLLCTQGSLSLDQLERSLAGRSPQTHRPEPPVADPFTLRCCPQSGIPSKGCVTPGPSNPMVGGLRLPTSPGRERLWFRSLRRRSQKRRLRWDRMTPHVERSLPTARICLPCLGIDSTLVLKIGAECSNPARSDLCGGRGKPRSLPRPEDWLWDSTRCTARS